MSETNNWPTFDWYGLYAGAWTTSELTPAAFSHPAKLSKRLAEHIYFYAKLSGWFKPGDRCIDPFAGIAGGAFYAMKNGLLWYGVELEPKWAKLGAENIAQWTERFGQMPGWGGAVIIQGDSRQLASIIKGLSRLAVGSPPFGEPKGGGGISAAMRGDGNYAVKTRMPGNLYQPKEHGASEGNLGNLKPDDASLKAALAISSPPYAKSLRAQQDGIDWEKAQQNGPHGEGHGKGKSCHAEYGGEPGQLAAMPEGDIKATLAVSSPPYAVINAGAGGLNHKPAKDPGQQSGRSPESASQVAPPRYGETPGQLSTLPPGDVQAALSVSSPPYASGGTHQKDSDLDAKELEDWRKDKSGGRMGSSQASGYGQSPGQLGAEREETFWSAARLIVEQVYVCLAPGGHAIWICGDFVRKKKRVPFSDQWRQLCEACGFEMVEWIRAWKVEHHGEQHLLEGGSEQLKTTRVSFFRRLAISKGSPAVLNEDVLVLRKPINPKEPNA